MRGRLSVLTVLLYDFIMIPFKINRKKYQVPTRWQDVCFLHYIELLKAPNNIIHQISIFTGISVESLTKAELKNAERIALAISFLNTHYVPGKPSRMVGKYVLPTDVTIQSLGQFEDLRGITQRIPEIIRKLASKEPLSVEENVTLANSYLEACAIYVQKIKDGAYDPYKVPGVMDELKQHSFTEIIDTGAFFLFRPYRSSQNIKTRFQNIAQRVRKLIQGLPGYQQTLDSLQRSSGSRGK